MSVITNNSLQYFNNLYFCSIYASSTFYNLPSKLYQLLSALYALCCMIYCLPLKHYLLLSVVIYTLCCMIYPRNYTSYSLDSMYTL